MAGRRFTAREQASFRAGMAYAKRRSAKRSNGRKTSRKSSRRR